MFFVHCFVYAIRELGDVLHGRTGILGFVSSSLGLFSVRCSDSCLRYWHYLEHFHFFDDDRQREPRGRERRRSRGIDALHLGAGAR